MFLKLIFITWSVWVTAIALSIPFLFKKDKYMVEFIIDRLSILCVMVTILCAFGYVMSLIR